MYTFCWLKLKKFTARQVKCFNFSLKNSDTFYIIINVDIRKINELLKTITIRYIGWYQCRLY